MRLDPITLRSNHERTGELNSNHMTKDVRSRRTPPSSRFVACPQAGNRLKSDDHSVLEPPLPIPNRTVKQDRADDSAHPGVKVGHRQTTPSKSPVTPISDWAF